MQRNLGVSHRTSISALAVALLATLVQSVSVAVQTDERLPRPTNPDSQGNSLYIVNLDLDAVERQVPAGEAPARAPMDPLNAIDFRGWHKPRVRQLVRQLERDYGIQATTMTSHALPSFSAYIPGAALDRIQRDPRVERLIPTTEAADFSQTPPWANQIVGGETIPYGKIAIGTNDSVSTGNVVYMIDAGPPAPHSDLVNIVQAPALNQPIPSALPHAFHVAGILSAAMNGAMVRGINPGAQIIAVNRGSTDAEIRQALDWVLGDAEWRGIHAIANVSSNSTRWANGDPSQIANFMRRMSNRVLVVQSAGNQHADACQFAYGPTSAKDGLIVVSAVDENGRQPVPFAINAQNWGGEPGANWGTCVEMWAPGQRVLSTWNTTPTAVIDLSGTSMAAPHVAALAARYGTTATTAVERERYVQSRLRGTGWSDDHGFAIVVPSYIQPPSFAVAPRLQPVSASADAYYPGYPASAAIDGNYLSTSWNSGHSAPGWIEVDLGASRSLDSLRLSPSQSPTGAATHYIYAGNSPSPTALIAIASGLGGDLEPFAVDLGLYYARYIRVYTSSSPSWVAWREIEVYGY